MDLKQLIDSVDNLNLSENTRYNTVNGRKEFTSTDGIICNVGLKGKTYINLARTEVANMTNPRNRVECNNVTGYREFTVFNKFTDKTIKVDVFESGVYKRMEEVSASSCRYIQLPESEYLGAYTFLYTEESSSQTLEEFKKSVIILEGDNRGLSINHFAGYVNAGTNFDGISFTSIHEDSNILKKEDFVVGSTQSTPGSEFIVDSKTNRLVRREPIPVELFESIRLDFADNVKCWLYELDENKVILKDYSWGKYKHATAVTRGTKFMQIIFAYDDDRQVTIDDFDTMKLLYTKKFDSVTVNQSLIGISDTLYDEINEHGKTVKMCDEVLVTGEESNIRLAGETDTTCVFQVTVDSVPEFDTESNILSSIDTPISDKFRFHRKYMTGEEHFYIEHLIF